MTPRRLVWLAFALGAVVTATVIFVPAISFVYRSPRLHVAMETAAIMIGLIAAVLVFGRFRRHGAVQDVVIVYALLVLVFTNLFFSAVPNAFGVEPDEAFLAWTQAGARVLASAVLVLAAFMKPRVGLEASGAAAITVASASATTLLVVAAAALALSPVLPDPLSAVRTDLGFRPSVDGHPVFLAAQLAQMALLGVAAAGFLKRAQTDTGPMTAWIAAGCTLSAFARFNYFLFPSSYTDYVYVGDFLRLGFYACLLMGGVKEISSYWRTLARAEVGEARQRLASDLHDGVAQELVFISAQAQRLLKRGAEPRDLQRLANAADRAVAESRRAMTALSSEREQPLHLAIAELTREVTRHEQVKVNLNLDPVPTSGSTREALIRLVREALMNAVRHSSPKVIRVELYNRTGPFIRVTDDGVGFDLEDELKARTGFGLVTLFEKAKALGGETTITSAPGKGTQVSIQVPAQLP